MSRATRRLAVIATAIATVAAGLIAAPAASAATVTEVSTPQFQCNSSSTRTSGVTLTQTLNSGDSLRISVSGNCNGYKIESSTSQFPTQDLRTFGTGNDFLILTGFTGTAGPDGLLAEVVSGSVRIAIRQAGFSTPAVVDKVTICHRTRAVTNPYVMITVSVNSVTRNNGHSSHTGPPFVPGFNYPANAKDWGDIIPPFTYVEDGVTKTYEGMNWNPAWGTPNPTGGNANWLEPAEIRAAIAAANETTSNQYLAMAKCMDLANDSGAQSTESAAIQDPQTYFNVMIQNGEDPAAVIQDLGEQDALNMTNPNEPAVVAVPTLDEAVGNYSGDPVPSVPSTAATGDANNVGRNLAQIRGSLSRWSTWSEWKFEWSRNENLTESSSFSSTGDPGGQVDREITGLACGTQYFYRLTGKDAGNNIRNGSTRSFTTAACPTLSVTTQPASNVTTTSATLNGALSTADDPNWVTRTFQWSTSIGGVTSSPSTSTTSTGSSGGSVSHVVTGLTCGTQYFFRVTGTDDTPQSANGSILNFTTAACPTGTPPGTSSTPPVIPPAGPPVVAGPPAFTPTLGSGRPPRLRLPPSGPPNRVVVPTTPGGTNDPNGTATTPNGQTPGTNTPGTNGSSGTNGGGDGGTNLNTSPPGTNGTGTTTAPPTPITTVYVPRTLTPTTSVPAPPGTEWEPTQTRIQDPQTGAPVMRVSNEAGTWVVNERSGDVTYTPRVGFTGAANVNVVLVARSGAIYIHPMRVPITFNARVRIISGDVPRDIAGGVARVNGPAGR